MIYFLKIVAKTSLLIAALITTAACGQKGPLEIDEPVVDKVTVQEEELEPTK